MTHHRRMEQEIERVQTFDCAHPNASARRDFLAAASALSGAGLLGVPLSARAEPAPEITQIRLVHDPAICFAPQYLAEELLHLEGFTDVKWTELATEHASSHVERGEADMTMDASPSLVYLIDQGASFVALAGIHAGCYELFGHDPVRALRDLKGKTVAVYALSGADYVLLSSMLAYVGIDPRKEVRWLADDRPGDAMQRFIDRKVDAFMGFAPQPQELRARRIGRLILNTSQDRPWSQYFCCALVANRTFVSNYPIATKRALRAYLKAADICARDPERVARYLVDRGFEPRYEIGLEVVKSLPYSRWRDSNPEDTFRFHALRLREVGMIKSSPQSIIARGTDWRFLKELKKELKA